MEFTTVRTCHLCGNTFKTRVCIDDKIHIIGNRKYCLDCSPFKQHNTRDLTQPRAAYAPEDKKYCCLCKETLPVTEYYLHRKTLQPNSFCKRCSNRQAVERQQKLKQDIISHLGGSCALCGYNRYAGALEVHHTDPDAKEFTLAHARSTTFAKVKAELEKCILLCANCHREEHARLKGLL